MDYLGCLVHTSPKWLRCQCLGLSNYHRLSQIAAPFQAILFTCTGQKNTENKQSYLFDVHLHASWYILFQLRTEVITNNQLIWRGICPLPPWNIHLWRNRHFKGGLFVKHVSMLSEYNLTKRGQIEFVRGIKSLILTHIENN